MDPRVRAVPRGRRMTRIFLAAVAAVTLLAVSMPGAALGVGQILDVHDHGGNVDHRSGLVQPSAAQLTSVSNLGATVRWNQFGTPSSLIRYGGFLASGLSGPDAATVARSWLNQNRSLFKLSSTASSSLALESASPMVRSKGHAVIFRQLFGGLKAARDGLITVGITGTASKGWKVAYVSSSSAGTQAAPQAAILSPQAAWRLAALDIGKSVSLADISNVRRDGSWTLFDVAGFSHPQRARLQALPFPGAGVRPVFETVVLNVQGGASDAFVHFIDARNSTVHIRENAELNLAQETSVEEAQAFDAPTTEAFEGSFGPGSLCGTMEGPYDAPAGTQSIVVTATSPGNDIILNLKFGGTTVASSDIPVGANPEVLVYEPAGGITAGDYFVEVCPFSAAEPAPPVYVGSITINDAGSTSIPYPPRWNFFEANPPLDLSDTDTRILACWEEVRPGVTVPNPLCELELFNLASRGTWDFDPDLQRPSFTTKGNAASTAEAWLSPLTPAEQYRPVRSSRQYDAPWQNTWQNADCNQSVFAPEFDPLDPLAGPSPVAGGNDIDSAIINLFSQHNRMHDWSYFLGFTERNFNMQQSNFGLSGEEDDPEIGNAQAGAVTGGAPSYLGRDNANQITLQDGVPGITNMYLWQPIAAAFYAPCVDGDFDQAVIGHEYTHAISTRMIGGADGGISSNQGRAMGESYSDLTAVEYLNEYGFVPTDDEDPFSVGAYVTGNGETGIRNYNMRKSPLNYSDIGYDFVCNAALIGPPVEPACSDGRTQVHADGEIWSATQFDVRKALVQKYNARFPASNKDLQARCADNELAPDKCPGNRRWMQLIFDSYLMLQSDLSMLDARDAMITADLMRFGGANQTELWRAFAKRGMGQFASDRRVEGEGEDAETFMDGDTIDGAANYETPRETNEGRVKFRPRAIDESGRPFLTNAKIYVGDYEAGAVPIADTDPSTPLKNKASFVPGTYDFLIQADGYGMQRVTYTVQPGADPLRVLIVDMPTNWASRSTIVAENAATITGDGVNKNLLIDDTEATNWAVLGMDNRIVDPTVTVDLAGAEAHLVGRVRVSAMLRPRDDQDPGDDDDLPGEEVGDTGSQSRFSAMREFRILTCNAETSLAGCTTPIEFTQVYPTTGSPAVEFDAGTPRPLAPNLILDEFEVQDSMATHVRLIALDNQCTGQAAYHIDDADPTNNADCRTSPQVNNLRAAELQVLSHAGSTAVVQDPVVALSMTAPATTTQGSNLQYTISYTNLGPAPSSSARILDVLPSEVTFVSASNGGSYDAATRRVTWNVGTVPVNGTGTRTLTVRVETTVPDLTPILNVAEFVAPLTVATPAASLTIVK
ncbi:MAG: M36 family metallopeptidase [Chloroflexi bacterium]|nr:M36 family metallopeptidase [Chloroflexota bacterium]